MVFSRSKYACILLLSSLLSNPCQAQNQFTGAVDGELGNGLNWSQGSAPAPGEIGFFLTAGDIDTFLANDLTTGELRSHRPFGILSVDLQSRTLTSDLISVLPTATVLAGPLSGGLSVKDGTVEANLRLEAGYQNNEPQNISATLSNVEWTGEEWLLLGNFDQPSPGFDPGGEVHAALHDGSKVTVDRLFVSENARVDVVGPGTELAFQEAVVAKDPTNPSIQDLYSEVAIVRAEAGGTIRTLATDPPIVGDAAQGVANGDVSALVHRMELDAEDTRVLATDSNLAIVDLRITGDARVETNRPVYIGAQAIITGSVASHDLISIFSPSVVQTLLAGTDLEHVVRLTESTLTGDVTDFRFVDLQQGTLNGDVTGAETILGRGAINGNVLQPSGPSGLAEFSPTDLIDVNGNVDIGVNLTVLLSSPPDENTPRLEVDSIAGVSSLEWTFAGSGDPPFLIDVEFDDLFHASVGQRLELLSTIDTTLNPGFLVPGDLATLNPLVRENIERQLAGISFSNVPIGYQFDVFIDPHAIGFNIVTVPELSNLVPTTVVLLGWCAMALRRRHSRGCRTH